MQITTTTLPVYVDCFQNVLRKVSWSQKKKKTLEKSRDIHLPGVCILFFIINTEVIYLLQLMSLYCYLAPIVEIRNYLWCALTEFQLLFTNGIHCWANMYMQQSLITKEKSNWSSIVPIILYFSRMPNGWNHTVKMEYFT